MIPSWLLALMTPSMIRRINLYWAGRRDTPSRKGNWRRPLANFSMPISVIMTRNCAYAKVVIVAGIYATLRTWNLTCAKLPFTMKVLPKELPSPIKSTSPKSIASSMDLISPWNLDIANSSKPSLETPMREGGQKICSKLEALVRNLLRTVQDSQGTRAITNTYSFHLL